MSVINQVLNQLERRGAPTASEQTMVCAVPQGERSFTLPWLVLVLALACGIAAWHWIPISKPVLSLVEGPKVVAADAMQRPPVVAIPAPASTVPAVASVAGATSAVVAASAVVAVGAVDAVGAASAGETSPAEIPPPASRLSLELGSASPRSVIRQGSVLRDVKNGIAANRGEKRSADIVPPAQFAKPQPILTASPNVRAAVQPPEDVSPMKQVSLAQHADAEFRKAVVSMQQGHSADAIAGYEAALRLDANHDAARQALVALLLEGKRGADAENVLQAGLKNKPEHTGFAMLLARLQVERGEVGQATETLEKTLPHADRQADYQAFLAALLQRQNRHGEAIALYRIALQLAPDNGVWLVGYGISLQAAQRNDDARDVFRRALESKALNPELRKFVQQKLKEL